MKTSISADSDVCPDDRDTEKIELLNGFFGPVSAAEVSLQGSQTLKVRGRLKKERLPMVMKLV